MNITKIIEEIAEVTPENAQAFTRDEAIKHMGNWGKKLAMAALPTGLLMLAFQEKARAGTSPSASVIGGVLNFALTLEYLESTFYNLAINANDGSGSTVIQTSANNTSSSYASSPGFINSGPDIAVFRQIQKHENAHVTLLLAAIGSLGQGVTANTKPDFDFTGGNSLSHNGPLSPFTDYPTFLEMSQAFEDTGVRAYKGQAGTLQFSSALVTALRIHSVEARHAAEVRKIRGEKGWITQANTTLPSLFYPVYGAGSNPTNYPSESNVYQATVNVYLNSQGDGVTNDAATEAFDEPLDMATVNTIASAVIIH